MASRHPSRHSQPTSPDAARASQAQHGESARPVPADDVLELLGDEYTRRILDVLGEGPRTCRELVEAADISKPTAYRRLEKLEEAGFLETSQRLHPDGHHCQEFCLVVDELAFEIGGDGFTATVQTEPPSPSHGERQLAGYTRADD